MKYPIVIELGDEKTACDVRIPDLDVFTAADTFEDCYAVAVEAAKIELDNMARNDRKIPTPSKVEDIVKNPEYKGFHVGLVDIDITPYLGKTDRLTITLHPVCWHLLMLTCKHIISEAALLFWRIRLSRKWHVDVIKKARLLAGCMADGSG